MEDNQIFVVIGLSAVICIGTEGLCHENKASVKYNEGISNTNKWKFLDICYFT